MENKITTTMLETISLAKKKNAERKRLLRLFDSQLNGADQISKEILSPLIEKLEYELKKDLENIKIAEDFLNEQKTKCQ